VNAILISYPRFKMPELSHIFKGLISNQQITVLSCFWWQDITIYIKFSMFTFRSTCLPASNRASEFSFTMFIFCRSQ